MRTILVASLVAVAACSIFGDFGQYSTEDPANGVDGGTGDSAVPGSDTGPSGVDGGADDADAGTSGAPFCATGAHAFCADFEQDKAIDFWSGQNKDPLATIEVSTTHAKGGKRALRVKMPRHETGKFQGMLYKDLPGEWRPTHVELDMYVEPPNWQSGDVNASLIELEYNSDTQDTTFFCVIGADYFNVGGANVNDTFGSQIETGKWVHVVMDLTTTSLAVTVDGVKRTHLFSLTPSGNLRRFDIALGVDGFNAPAPELDIYYDNVTVDFQ